MIIPRRRVSVHPNYFRGLDENTTEYDSLLEIAKEFAKYWRKGYHQDFGRDKPIEYPAVKDAGLCKVHVLVFPLSKKISSFGTQKAIVVLDHIIEVIVMVAILCSYML